MVLSIIGIFIVLVAGVLISLMFSLKKIDKESEAQLKAIERQYLMLYEDAIEQAGEVLRDRVYNVLELFSLPVYKVQGMIDKNPNLLGTLNYTTGTGQLLRANRIQNEFKVESCYPEEASSSFFLARHRHNPYILLAEKSWSNPVTESFVLLHEIGHYLDLRSGVLNGLSHEDKEASADTSALTMIVDMELPTWVQNSLSTDIATFFDIQDTLECEDALKLYFPDYREDEKIKQSLIKDGLYTGEKLIWNKKVQMYA